MKFPYFLNGGAAVDPPEIKFLAGTEVFFMSGIMFLLGTYGGRFLNKLFPSYDANKKSYVQSIEVVLQAGTTGLLTYIMRELMISSSISLFGPTDQLSQSTGYAATLYAFGLLSTQSELKKKLQHLLPLNESNDNTEAPAVTTYAPVVQKRMTNKDVINQRIQEQGQGQNGNQFSGTGMESFGCGRGSGRTDCFDNQEGFASCGRSSGRPKSQCGFTDGDGNDNDEGYGGRDYVDGDANGDLEEDFSSCGRRNSKQDSRESFYNSPSRANSNNKVSGTPDNVGGFFGGLSASPFDFTS